MLDAVGSVVLRCFRFSCLTWADSVSERGNNSDAVELRLEFTPEPGLTYYEYVYVHGEAWLAAATREGMYAMLLGRMREADQRLFDAYFDEVFAPIALGPLERHSAGGLENLCAH